MHDWAVFGAWEERRAELMREAEHRRLVRELREARGMGAEGRSGDGYPELRDSRIEVRWGLPGSREELPARGWRRVFALLGTLAVPFFRAPL